MLTHISWAPDVGKDEKIVRIPRADFDCPKMHIPEEIGRHSGANRPP